MGDVKISTTQNEDLNDNIIALFNIFSRIGDRFQQFFSPILQNENIKTLGLILKTIYMTDWLKYMMQHSIYRKYLYFGAIAWIIFADIAFSRSFSIRNFIINIPRAILSILFIPFHISFLCLILLMKLDRKLDHILSRPFEYLCFRAGYICFEIYKIILKNFKHWDKPLHVPFSSKYIRILWSKLGYPTCILCYKIGCKVWKAVRPTIFVFVRFLDRILRDIYLIALPLWKICSSLWRFVSKVASAIISLIFTIVHSFIYTFRRLFSLIF